jgi:hypothetical protein
LGDPRERAISIARTTKTSAMPTDQRLWLDDRQGVHDPRQQFDKALKKQKSAP